MGLEAIASCVIRRCTADSRMFPAIPGFLPANSNSSLTPLDTGICWEIGGKYAGNFHAPGHVGLVIVCQAFLVLSGQFVSLCG